MLKIGVFGAYRGKTMIDVLMKYREAQLVAVCDKYPPALDAVARSAEDANMEVALYTNFDDFIQHDMDAVVLANYANEHATFAIRCLKAGKHVLSECLPCETMAQAVELIETVEQTGLVYAYAENYCYMRDTFEMWKKFRGGDYGDVVYADAEYIHDCSSIWPQISYGERNHWRNRMHPNFYCTHSLGPIITITGKRPVKVVGYEIRPTEKNIELTGRVTGAGLEMVTLENGAVVRSIHGGLKRTPGGTYYAIYGENGFVESKKQQTDGKIFRGFREHAGKVGEGDWESYDPQNDIGGDIAKEFASHGGSDFYPTYFFIQKILGKPDGVWSIDVYTAVNMGICGLLAWRSCLNGNTPMDIPDLSRPEERDKWRNDNACTNPELAGEQVLPVTSYNQSREVPDSVYDRVRILWEKGLDANADIEHFTD